jgi:hypothetical protein
MVTLGGHVICGGLLSITVIVCTQVLVFPQPSDADHVRVMVVNTGHDPATVTSLNVIVGEATQLSVAVAVPVAGGNVLAVHWMVTFAGQVIVGGTASSTVIVCTQELELPQSSVARHVREITLSAEHTPGVTTSVNVIVADASQLSVAVAVPVPGGNVLAPH